MYSGPAWPRMGRWNDVGQPRGRGIQDSAPERAGLVRPRPPRGAAVSVPRPRSRRIDHWDYSRSLDDPSRFLAIIFLRLTSHLPVAQAEPRRMEAGNR